MAPPRFQCLNAARQVVKPTPSVRAAFSTAQASRADGPTTRRSPSSTSKSGPQSKAAGVSNSFSFSTSPRAFEPVPLDRNPISDSQTNSRNSQATINMAKLIYDAKIKREQKAAAQAAVGGEKSVGDHFRAQDFSKQISRRWRAGDVYAPHDLSGVEMKKWKQRSQPTHDVFDLLAFNPEQHYRNFSIMSEYITPMGRIKHSRETGLRPVNQRRIARAIRRTVGIGMMPSVHRHPELLYKESMRSQNYSPTRGPRTM